MPRRRRKKGRRERRERESEKILRIALETINNLYRHQH